MCDSIANGARRGVLAGDIIQPFTNLYVSNSVTASNLYGNLSYLANNGNYLRLFADGTLAFPNNRIDVAANSLTVATQNPSGFTWDWNDGSGSLTEVNVNSGGVNFDVATPSLTSRWYFNLDGSTTLPANLYVANALTTTNATITGTLGVDGAMTSNAANTTFFYDTFTIPYINTQLLNVTAVTGLSSLNLVSLNVQSLFANSATIYGANTLNVLGISNLNSLVTPTANVGTLNVATVSNLANLVLSNTLSTTNLIASGNVVIGPTPATIQANLHVEQGSVFIGNSAVVGATQTSTGGAARLVFDNSANTSIYPNKIVLFANTSSSQYCGFGITSIGATGGTSIAYGSRQNHIFYTGTTINNEIMRITAVNTVGVGTFSPAAKLHVGLTQVQNVQVLIDGSNVSLATTGSGLVGFGTTTPTANLHVIGNLYASNALQTTNLFVTGNVATVASSIFQSFNFTVAATAGSYTNVCSIIDSPNGSGIYVIYADMMTRGAGGSAQTKAYIISCNYNATAGVWTRALPISNPSAGGQIGLDVMTLNGTTYLRATNRNAAEIVSVGMVIKTSSSTFSTVGITDLTAQTGTGATSTGFYPTTVLTQVAGRVGISTEQPASNLHVVGNIYASNSLTGINVLVTGGIGIGPIVLGTNVFVFSNVSGGSNVLIMNNLGNVGIATTNPGYLLDVGTAVSIPASGGETIRSKGPVIIGNGSNDGNRFISALDSSVTTNDSRYITFGKAGSIYNQVEFSYTHAADGSTNNRLNIGFFSKIVMSLLASGSIGVGTITPSATLHVVGNAYVSNALQTTNVYASSIIPTYPISFRNRIINGDFLIDQRNSSANSTPASTLNVIDRWKVNIFGSGRCLVGQNLGAVASPPNFTSYYGMKVTTTTTVGSGDYFFFSQVIEGVNMVDWLWGTSNAKPVTLSFWAYSSLTGTMGGFVRNSGATAGNYTRSYPFTFSVSSANTWEYKTIVIAGDTTGQWITGQVDGPEVGIELWNGTAFQNTASTWSAGNFTGPSGGTANFAGTLNSYLYLTGIQVELGSVATQFERRHFNFELAACQRYYETTVARMGGYHTAGNFLRSSVYFNTKKRPAGTPGFTVVSTLENSNMGSLSLDNSNFDQSSARILASVTATGDAYAQWKVAIDCEF